MNQPNDLAGRPHAKILVSIQKDLPSPLPRHQGPHLLEFTRRAGLLDPCGLGRDAVLEQPARVLPAAQHELRVRLRGVDDGLLDVVVDGGLERAHEARAHVDALGAQGQGRGQTLAVGEATGCDEGYVEGLARAGQEDEVGDVGLADVAGALEPVDGEEVDAEFDGGDGVADGGALVQDYAVGFFQLGDHGSGAVAGGFDDGDSFVDHDLRVFGVGGCVHGGEEGDVHAEGEGGHGLAFADFFAQVFGRWLG